MCYLHLFCVSMENGRDAGLGFYVPANVLTLLLYTIDGVSAIQEEEEENGEGIGKKSNSFEELSG